MDAKGEETAMKESRRRERTAGNLVFVYLLRFALALVHNGSLANVNRNYKLFWFLTSCTHMRIGVKSVRPYTTSRWRRPV